LILGQDHMLDVDDDGMRDGGRGWNAVNSGSDVKNWFSMEGETQNCESVISGRSHILVGISPFNSRFSPEYVRCLLSWGRQSFTRMDVLVPDEDSAVMLLIARGMATGKARRKVRKELGRHHRVLDELLHCRGWSHDVTVHEFADFRATELYRQSVRSAEDAFKVNEEFKHACVFMVKQAIAGSSDKAGANRINVSDEIAEIALPYVFSELPFYTDSAGLLGVESSVLAYHRSWPVSRLLHSGEVPVRVSARQAHGIVRILPSLAAKSAGGRL